MIEPLTVDSYSTAEWAAHLLLGTTGPFGVDTETTGCNPRVESPVGRAKLWCLTIAWRDTEGNVLSLFALREWLWVFRLFLESPYRTKVGANLWGFDRHVFANEGIELRGIVADTNRMARLLDPAHRGGLKDDIRELGLPVVEYGEVTRAVAGREVAGKPARYHKRTGALLADEQYMRSELRWDATQEIDLELAWQDPERREAIRNYALQDARGHLLVAEHRAKQLEQRAW